MGCVQLIPAKVGLWKCEYYRNNTRLDEEHYNSLEDAMEAIGPEGTTQIRVFECVGTMSLDGSPVTAV